MKGLATFHAGLPPLFHRLSPGQPASPQAHQQSPNLPSCQVFLSLSPVRARTAHLRTASMTMLRSRQTTSQKSWLLLLKVCSLQKQQHIRQADITISSPCLICITVMEGFILYLAFALNHTFVVRKMSFPIIVKCCFSLLPIWRLKSKFTENSGL